MRQTTGSVFFRDNKIRSCSYIKETANGFKAVPFYDKRDNKLYPTPSTVTKSWNSTTYVKPNTVYAGMGTHKPLHAVLNQLFSMILLMLEILQQYLILDHLIPIPLKLKQALVQVEMQSITLQATPIVSSTNQSTCLQIILGYRLSETNGYDLVYQNDWTKL